jgi:hypothetical protein
VVVVAGTVEDVVVVATVEVVVSAAVAGLDR